MKEKDDNAREITKQAILSYLADGETHRSSDMTITLHAHNRERRFSKNTIYKYRAELIEDGLVEMKIGSPRDPRPRYRITEKGIEQYQKTVMLSDHMKELQALSRDELILRLAKYHIIKKYESLPLPQRIKVLEELAEQGDPVAAKKLKEVKEGLEELERFEKEVAEAHPDKKFEVLMKWRRKDGLSDSS